MNKDRNIRLIIEAINDEDEILIFPHISLDGDCLGSAMAFCHTLRKLGKKSYILLEDEIPDNLKFLVEQDYITYNTDIFSKPEICISVDCGDDGRYPKRAETYHKGLKKICIDHHVTNQNKQDVNYIDPNASATGELIFHLINGMEEFFGKDLFDEFSAQAIYVAIVRDTGNFSYTNTTKNTHLIVANLFNYNLDLEKIGVELYQNIRIEKLYLNNEVLNTIEMFCNGKANLAYLTQDMLKNIGALRDESDGLIDRLRELKGVEISAFLKEDEEGGFKVSLRSKTFADVGAIAAKFGGGGHKKAAGFNFYGNLEETIKLVKEEICAKVEL